jgi:hypothetical protein
VLTGKGDTVDKSFERYAKTTHFIFQLFSQLPWERRAAVDRINQIHRKAAQKLQELSKEDLNEKVFQKFQSLPTKKVAPVTHLDKVSENYMSS